MGIPRVAFVVHVMQVAGAEMLVAELCRRLRNQIDPLIVCLDAQGQLGAELLSEGVPVIVLKRQPGIDVSTGVRLGRLFRRYGVDVVHAHQYTPFFYAAVGRLFAGLRPKVVLTEHGRHYPDIVSTKRRLMNQFVLARLANRVTGVCEFSAKGLREKDGFAARPIEVIENGIDLQSYDAVTAPQRDLRVSLGLDPNRRYVICVARFHPVKDHATLIQAFSIVAGRAPDVDLLLVGDGSEKGEMEKRVQELGTAGRVHFLGIRRDVPQLLHASDLFAMASVSEAASITVLEAMACRLPAVLTAVGGNPEIVRDGREGYLVPRGDVRAMADTMMSLLTNDEWRQRMGAAARARVEERFQLTRTVEQYRLLYDELARPS